MTPFEIFIHNRSVLSENIGTSSFTMCIDFKDDRFDSTSGCAALIRNDVPKLLNGQETNAKKYFDKLHLFMANMSKEIGEDKQDFEETVKKFKAWCEENGSKDGIGCPHKLYFVTYSSYNANIIDRMFNKFVMMFMPHPFVIHLVRDRCYDMCAGGYFMQIHCYKKKHATYIVDPDKDQIENEFLEKCYDNLMTYAKTIKCPVYVLTNPGIFDRLCDWFKRCYARYNSFFVGIVEDIKCAVTGKILTTNEQ